MPRISAFYGIVIWMYHDEIHRRGRPHFHASYGENEASIDIETLSVIAGGLPPRARRLVVEWARSRNRVSNVLSYASTARLGASPHSCSRR
jgi:hypothetical protein